VAPRASLGPGLLTRICHCTLAPGTTGLVSVVLATATSPCGFTVSITVSLSLPGLVSVKPAGTVRLAVLLTLPVTPESRVPSTV